MESYSDLSPPALGI